MSKPKHVGLLSMCKRVAPTNMEKVAELTEKAKGNRTVVSFAEACGVNPATISRIINVKFKKNLSDDVVAAIAVNAMNSSGSFFKELLDAHGLVIPAAEGADNVERLYTDYLNQVRSSVEMSRKTRVDQTITPAARKEALVTRIQEIVQNHLIEAGYSVGRMKDKEAMDAQPFPWNADFVLKTDALESEGLSKWAFEVNENVGWQFSREMERLAGIAYFAKPAKNGYRITLVTTDRDNFYVERQTIRDMGQAYDSLSILLVNTRYNYIEAEYVLERDVETAKVLPAGKDDSEIDWAEIYGVPDDV